jgi:glycolate oxidase iron-sulfur subunit
VEYGNLLEAARYELRDSEKSGGFTYLLQSFVLRFIWTSPGRLQFLFALARIFRDLRLTTLILNTRILSLISPRVAFALALLEASAPASLKITGLNSANQQKFDGPKPNRQRLMLFKGCVTEGLFRRVNEATRRVLAANNYETVVPREQVCCGALHAHSGDLEGARALARRNIVAFEAAGEVPIVTNAGGCGAMLCSYGHLLAQDTTYAERARSFSERIQDVSQVLPNNSLANDECEIAESITYDASCHLLNGQRASDASLRMLLSAPGVNFRPLPGSEVCCGGAGIYNLLEPELSAQVLGEKLKNIEKSGASTLATGNPGCHMQIKAGSIMAGKGNLKVFHPVEILDESYRCAGLYSPNPELSTTDSHRLQNRER